MTMARDCPVPVFVLGTPPKDFGLSKAEVVQAARFFAARSRRRLADAPVWHEVAVHLIHDAQSDEMHRAIMNIAGATDVITQAYDAIPPEEPGLYGELFVNVDQARRAAPRRKGWSAAKELLLYVAHGMDHLSGADDHAPADYARMRRRELGWLAKWRGALALLAAMTTLALGAEPGATFIDNGGFEKLSGAKQATRWHYSRRGWTAAEGVGVKGSRALVYANADPALETAPWQFVDFEKGHPHVISADVRIAGSLQGTGEGAYVAAEWLDEKGNCVGEVRTKALRTSGESWRHVSAMSGPVPDSAVRCRVSFGVTKGCTGHVVFDNVRFARWYAPRLTGLSTSAPNNQAAEGEIDVIADLDATDADLAAHKAVFSWRGADGRTHTAPPDERNAERARITLRVRDLAVGPSQIAFVLFRPNGEIDARRELTFVRQTARR